MFSRNFPALVACKTSKFIIAADSVAVDEVTKLTDVGYNFGQVKISSFSTSC